ncbi:hypothetical protein MANES_14G101000v8 [Manihot esculenta]|uniref:Uncharacterized protein n=1 Tax=Manihot esculenta TaxID=3983 RepID=A0ACB7GK29_MANES|nr:hypothetical protein MANES_14G101000v8 [Manihot esculenta]
MRRYFLNSNPTPALQEPPPPPPPQLVLQDSSITAAAEPNASGQTPLSAIVDAFEDLAKLLKSITDQDNDVDRGELQLDVFCDSCSPVSVLFSCLGLAFKFAESEYVAKVASLVDASKRHKTLQSVLDLDVANGTVRTAGSHSRNLRRVSDESLKDAATTAYSQVCAPFHTWAVRAAVYAGMYTLPSRDQLLLNLSETNQTAEKKMRRYINASLPVIEYIDKLYISRNISLDW